MPVVRCSEGHEIHGEDRAQLLAGARAHLREAHPELRLPDSLIEDYVSASLRMGEPRPRLTQISTPAVVPLTPDQAEAWLRFFDGEGFTDNPAWAGCYCMYYRFGGTQEEWQQRRAVENRDAAATLIAQGQQTGFLAYVDGTPAGWLNTGPRSAYRGLPDVEAGESEDAAITCFVIAPPYRRHGVARALLDEATTRFRAAGYARLLAYPVKDADSTAAMYHGPIAMYEAAGFQRLGEDGHMMIMAKMLT